MFLRVLSCLIFGATLWNASLSLAQSEEVRREGFYQHQRENQEWDLQRQRGLKDFLKEQDEWEEQKKKDLAADKKRKKVESPVEGGPEYKADQKEKLEDYEDYEASRKAYIKEKKTHEAKNAAEQAKRDAWAMEEYGLDRQRPRYDIAKRALYNGKGVASGSSGSTGGSHGSTGGANYPPPPPAFDDFGEGYIPPPPPPESFEAPPLPPESFPVPPAPFPANPGGDFDNGFYPPPPPPIPAPGWGEGF